MADVTDKIKEALQAGRSGQVSRKTPYERFGFQQNPFQLKSTQSAEELFIMREDVLVNFATQIGYAIRLFEEDSSSPFRHQLTHGLHGSGKTTIAQHFTEEWEKFGFKDYETIFTSLKNWREPQQARGLYSASSKTLQTYERFLNEILRATKPLILFVDDFDYTITGTSAIPRCTEFFADIVSRAPYGAIIVAFVNSLTLTILVETENTNLSRSFYSNFNPDHFFFPVFSKTEVRQLLIKRLRDVRKPIDLFSVKSLEVIADHSMGLPPIALKIASACLHELITQNIERVTSSLVMNVINQSGFRNAVSLIESLDHAEVEDSVNILTPKRRDIVISILQHQTRERYFFPPTGADGLRISNLAQQFGVNLSTMNYHIKPLTQTEPLPILESQDDVHDARSKIFKVDMKTPIASALEILTVYHKLQAERYHGSTHSIQVEHREAERT
ncbi:MAG: hypothetical protein ACW98F_02350 [Candidatus Hodarchaeales archaeon]|jgi:hypothetical protein